MIYLTTEQAQQIEAALDLAQALLEKSYHHDTILRSYKAIRAAREQEQSEQEPVADVFKFLLGEGELEGCSFGERNEAVRGNFWWRKHLRKALAEQAEQEPVATDSAKKDAVFEASIQFIKTLTGMEPPPIETAPTEVFAPFREFTEKVCQVFAADREKNK